MQPRSLSRYLTGDSQAVPPLCAPIPVRPVAPDPVSIIGAVAVGSGTLGSQGLIQTNVLLGPLTTPPKEEWQRAQGQGKVLGRGAQEGPHAGWSLQSLVGALSSAWVGT